MNENMQRLLSMAGPRLAEPCEAKSLAKWLQPWGRLGHELGSLLAERNGFYAFESALLVRPISEEPGPPMGIAQWNDPLLWKGKYRSLGDCLAFSEDVFGCQHCLCADGIHVLEPETGEMEGVAASLDEWAAVLLSDPDFRTGFPLAHDWQERNRPLRPGERLLPKKPFCLGGAFELENLDAVSDAEGMRFRATLAAGIEGVPDGQPVVLRLKP